MKNIVIAGAVLIVILTALYFYTDPKMDAQLNTSPDENNTAGTQEEQELAEDTIPTEEPQQPEGKLKADTFTGTLEEVNTGCFADGECFVVVDGKHITVLMGWSRDTVGSVIGADGIGGLESSIGQEVEVYAQDNSDGTYTLYGSEGFYVKAI